MLADRLAEIVTNFRSHAVAQHISRQPLRHVARKRDCRAYRAGSEVGARNQAWLFASTRLGLRTEGIPRAVAQMTFCPI
jgi:hypothetical protein